MVGQGDAVDRCYGISRCQGVRRTDGFRLGGGVGGVDWVGMRPIVAGLCRSETSSVTVQVLVQ